MPENEGKSHTFRKCNVCLKMPFSDKKRSLFCIHSGDKTPHKITSYFTLCKNAFYYGKCSFHWWLSGPFWTGIIFNRVIVFVCLCVCESVPYNLKNCWPISMKFDRVIYIDKKQVPVEDEMNRYGRSHAWPI